MNPNLETINTNVFHKNNMIRARQVLDLMRNENATLVLKVTYNI